MTCQNCKGSGFLSHFENQSPMGSGLIWNEEISELCTCLENDQCPNCSLSWEGRNADFNRYCNGDNDEFGCIYCSWQSNATHLRGFVFEGNYYLTPEEKIKPWVDGKEERTNWFY